MSAPAHEPSRVAYRVTRPAPDRLHVEARVTPAAAVSVLTLRDAYGPAHGFAAGIVGLTVGGPQARATVAPARVMVASAAPFSLAYDCLVPAYDDAVSLLRGFARGDATFIPGMALFHRLHDPATRYDVEVDAAGVAVPAAPAGTAIRWRGAGAAALERAYFALGDVAVDTAGQTSFVHERGFPFAVDGLVAAWPPLVRHLGRLFGGAPVAPWTALLFASREHRPGRPGAGFALPGGALVSVSAGDDALASPHTLWLLLHEYAHQWLGEAIGRAQPADDWFFEGFASFAATETLAAGGHLSAPALARLVAISRRAVRTARTAGRRDLAHEGFLCARRWNRVLARRGGSVGDVIAAVVTARQGATLTGAALLAALEHASPDRTLPDFVLRCAADAGP